LDENVGGVTQQRDVLRRIAVGLLEELDALGREIWPQLAVDKRLVRELRRQQEEKIDFTVEEGEPMPLRLFDDADIDARQEREALTLQP